MSLSRSLSLALLLIATSFGSVRAETLGSATAAAAGPSILRAQEPARRIRKFGRNRSNQGTNLCRNLESAEWLGASRSNRNSRDAQTYARDRGRNHFHCQ